MTTMRPTPVIAPGNDTPPRGPADTPIFEALATRWAAAGRSVPCRDDQEWTLLAERIPWPDR
ncbi:hypothetical protein ACFZB6_31910 [Streptomyces syringium]|uniref:hypothetical protein n=1 Tax=Streptomyces TaxID=1883 RepID=UPI0033B78C45